MTPGVATPPAAGRGAGPARSGAPLGFDAVLINVPGAQSSGTLTSPAGSYQYRDLISVHDYTAGTAISGDHAYGHGDLTGRQPVRRWP